MAGGPASIVGIPPAAAFEGPLREITAALAGDGGARYKFDPDQPRDDHGRWTEGGAASSGAGAGSEAARRGGARSADEAQRAAEAAAAGHAKLDGLPDKPIKIGDEWYVPGPFGKAKDAAERYMRDAGLPHDPPQQYLKVDKERAARIANEFDRMKHDPDDPRVKASYDALTKETIAQWHAIRDTGLVIEWIKPDQADPYAATPRLAAMDVINNNHWWGFPTDAGFGSGEEAESAKHNNPMLQMTDEVVDGRRLMVNDIFRIVHDYFGHFKEGVGFRADGEENAWRAHASMYSDLARAAMTSETRGQNSWVNFGPYGEANRTASAGDTHYAPQKIGLMADWTQNEGRRDEGQKAYRYITLREASRQLDPATYRKYRDVVQRFFAANMHLALDVDCILLTVPVRAWDESQHPREPAGSSTGGQFTSGGGGDTSADDKPAELDPTVVEVGGDEWNRAVARRLEREYQAARPKVDQLAQESPGQSTEVSTEEEEEGEPPYEPESWDGLSASGQSQAESEYISKMEDNYYDGEVEHWRSETAPDEAKVKVADDFNDRSEDQWAMDALNDLREEWVDAGKENFPFSNVVLLNAITIEYDQDNVGSWPKKDPELTFDDEKLTEPVGYDPAQQTLPGIEPIQPHDLLTEDMREEIEKALLTAFDKEADSVADKLEPPDYLKDSANELAEESWSQMEDDDKFEWTKSHTSIVEDESTEGTGSYAGETSETITVEGLPNTYDPLNNTSGRDYQRTQKLARYLSEQRALQVLRERGILGEDAVDAPVARIDSKLWGAWKGSSTSDDGKLLQLAAADELGGRLNPVTHRTAGFIDRVGLESYANREYSSIGGYAGVKAYVRAKWEVSQYLLDKAGIQELGLYRGIKLERDVYQKFLAAWRKHYEAMQVVGNHKLMPTLHVARNGAASTTTDPKVANGWGADDTRIVLRASVPRTAVLSVPAYGINVHSEHEVVVAGTAWKGWDAWAGKAPRFEDVPLKVAA